MIVLLTAFEPFNNQAENASSDVLNHLDIVLENVTLVKTVIPVLYDKNIYKYLLENYHPDIVLHLGEAGRRSLINLEIRGVNVMNAPIPDNAGILKTGEPIKPFGPDEFLSTLPIKPMIESLKTEGYPIDSSETAGTFICNLALYSSLEAVRTLNLSTKVGFIHFPRLSHQLNPKDMPTLTLKEATDTLVAILKYLTK